MLWGHCPDCEDSIQQDVYEYQLALVNRYDYLVSHGPKDDSDERLLLMVETGQIELPRWYKK